MSGTLALLAAAFALRLHLLADKAIWWDEGWSVWLARQDFIGAALRTASDEHPPLHYWFLHVWIALVGDDAFAARFSSVAFGVLAVALTYRLGKDLAGSPTAVLGAALLTISRFHIAWSQEIKMYAPGVLLALVACLALVRLWRTGRKRYAALWAISTWLCLMTLYLGILVVMAQGVAVLWTVLRTGRLGKIGFGQWLALQAVTAAAYLPWLWVYKTHAYPFQAMETFDLMSALRLYATVLPLGVSTDLDPLALPALGFTALAVAGALAGRGKPPQWRLLGLAVITLPAALLLFSLPHQAIYQPKVSERYMVLFVPLYLLLVAAGIEQAARLRRSFGAAVGLAAAGGMLVTLGSHYAERRPDREAPALAYAVASQLRPDDIVVLNADKNWPVYAYYLHLPEDRWLRIPYGAAMSPGEADHWLQRLSGRKGAVWLITTPTAARTDPRNDVQRWMDDRYASGGDWRFQRSRVALYTPDGSRTLGELAPAEKSGAPAVAQVEDIRLGGYSDLPPRMRPGETAYVFSEWDALEATSRDYRARLLLARPGGADERPRRWEPLAPGAPESVWRQGDAVLARHLLAAAPQQAPGLYDVMLEVEREQQRSAIRLGSIEVQAAPEAVSAAPLGERIASFGNLAVLQGVRLPPSTVEAGQPITVEFQWQASAETNVSYTVFVHLVGPDGAVWGSGDGLPGDGEMPTTGWTAGDLIADRHTMMLPSNAPPGRYHLLVGLYDSQNSERLPAFETLGGPDDDGAVAIGEFAVAPGS